MHTLRTRSTVLAAACLMVFAAGCEKEGSPSEDAASSAEGDASGGSSEIEGVEHFYGEYGDYLTTMAAIGDGEVTAEDLDHPWVAQQEHLDALPGWDGTLPVYETIPPAGGNHLSVWQTCTGTVYGGPVVDGHAVHSLEHGAVWLTYEPDLLDDGQIASLAKKIEGRDYSLMSPYPGQGAAVSLQSWGNRYQTEDPADPNIDAYLDAYILNEAYNPEAHATCSGGISTLARLPCSASGSTRRGTSNSRERRRHATG